MELRVLGPFDAREDDAPLALGTPKARALLARLALDANRAVPTRQIVDDLWGEDVPESAVKMVQVYVSHLRKVLPAKMLVTRPPGYLVQLDPEALDLTRFLRLRDQGRAALAEDDPHTAATRFGEALALWRGPALAEFSEPFARVEAAHLEELRLTCLEDRIASDLAAGFHGDVVGELELLVTHHPLRETLQRSLILALYRSGRQAEALAAYDRFRRALDDELGLEPSRALKVLQQQMLTQDPSLDLVVLASPDRRTAQRALVGREAEVQRLEAALDEAIQSRGGAVVISGPAGIGKTRLGDELTAIAQRRGAQVLSGHCIQLVGSSLPYLPIVDALRPIRSTAATGELHELPRLIPEFGRGAAGPGGPGSRLRLFEEVLGVLDRLSSQSPLVLLLGDLHWADASTLDLVAYLAHTVSSRRILLVATTRSEALEPGSQLHALAATAGVLDLPLDPLADPAIEALLSEQHDTPVQELVSSIVRRSQGNPLYAGELLAAARRGETSLPRGLRDLLLASVARLDSGTRSVLRVVAAVGRPVSFRLLSSVTAMNDDVLADALRDATDHDVLVPDAAAKAFRFRHELYAEAMYATLLPGERELLHARLAQALSDEPQLGGGGAAELAHHWAAAERPVEALGASLLAAREAEAVSGLSEALGHVERVLELWDEVPGAEQLAGVGLPSVLAWAIDLADASAPADGGVDAGAILTALAPAEELSIDTLAGRLALSARAARAGLRMLEREGLVERVGQSVRAAPLAIAEASRLYPLAVVLESLAVRISPRFEPDDITALREANTQLLMARNSPAAAVAADDHLHRLLTRRCGNAHLLTALGPVKRALLRYERVFMLEPEHVDRAVAGHEPIIAALERGDHPQAAQLVRGNLTYGLDDLRDALER